MFRLARKSNIVRSAISVIIILSGFLRADAAREKFILLDERIIENIENAKLTVGTVEKHKRNPLFAEDKPWEPRFDNLYANILYDEADDLYKCWYSPFIIDESTTNTPRKDRVNGGRFKYQGKHTGRRREMGICYAVSRNGIRWEKPNLGVVEFDGSKENNIVWRGPHGTGIFKDSRDPDPKRRYKAFFKGKMISVGFSPDGIHWSDAIECPEANVRGDTHNNAFWAPTLGEYIGITRTWAKPRGRQVARTSSKDFLKWTRAEVVLEGIENHLQTYAMPVFYYAGVYIGLPAIYNSDTDRTHTELAWSPDTITWHRIDPGTPLIANSSERSQYDWGTVYAAAYPVFLKDEIRLYYGGCDDKHFGWRNGYFCLATLRPDSFAGYETVDSDQPAYIKTIPVVCTGEGLRICADVEKNGYVKTQLFDSNNKPLAEGELIAKTVTDGPIQWKDGFSFNKLRGKEIKLRFELRESKLYSFNFVSLESKEQPNGHGFISIFDGKTLDGWHAAPKESASDWSVHNGVIFGEGSADRLSYLVWKDDHLRDFELILRYRLPDKGNTGVEIRSQPDRTGKRPFKGYHADLGHVGIGPHILGAWDFHFAKRKEYPCQRGTRLVIDEDDKPHSSTIQGALTATDVRRYQWNDVRIIARGNHFQFFINDKLASEFTDNAKRGRLEQGAIGLQIHDKGMQVEFKDIQLRRLAVTGDSKAFFSEQPIWSSGTAKSGGDGIARFIDFDRDGDLDFVTSAPNPKRWVLYRNQDGKLAKKPFWESRETTDCDHRHARLQSGWLDGFGRHTREPLHALPESNRHVQGDT
ncbi:family 16 glycoside hydrolase [Planctomycetota bacterium]